MDNAFASASAISDQRQKIEQYKLILSSVITSNDISQAKKFIDHSGLSLIIFRGVFLSLFIRWFQSRNWYFNTIIIRFVIFFGSIVLSDDVPLVVSRQLLQMFAQELGRLEAGSQKEIAHYTLTQIQPRVVSFEEQVGCRYLCVDNKRLGLGLENNTAVDGSQNMYYFFNLFL